MLVCVWYNSVCHDKRYKGLMRTLDIPAPTATRCMFYRAYMYHNSNDKYNARVLKDCISKGDGTPAQLENLRSSNNMERYKQSVPAFTYNAAVFPPYGDTIHHWFIEIYNPNKLVSLITDSKEEISNDINNASYIDLHFVPLPDTLQ